MKKEDDLTAEALRAALTYDPETGEFRWRHRPEMSKQWNARFSGAVAGWIMGKGYRMVALGGADYYAHRLAWLYVTGEWPREEVDHKDGKNNRWDNLRLASHAENGKNVRKPSRNTSGVKGVTWYAQRKKWRAQIGVNGRNIALGDYPTIDEAAAAYARASKQYHGEFGRLA